MGLIRSAGASVDSQLADQWLEVITAEDMGINTAMCVGKQKTSKRKGLFSISGSNTKGSEGIITNGSKIQVFPNQMLIMVEGGKIVDFTAEE
ncbi:MAG: virion core protein, partial [Oscillospiraceae bacterium]|nr:virion core protein [Oscillospiraceae bacterium]